MSRPLMFLLVLPLALLACQGEDPVPTPDASVQLAPGDWTDEGPFAQCHFVAGACGTRETLVPADSCDRGSLAGFAAEGTYTLHVRAASADTASFRSMAVHLTSDGGTQWAGGLPLEDKQVAADGLYLRGTHRQPDGGTLVRAFSGCRVPAAGELTGCFSECRNGQPLAQGSFTARRVARSAGEPEASGLTLVSETAVSPSTAADVYVIHGHAYVVSLGAGLHVYDVRDPARPVLTQHIYSSTDNYWNGVWAKGNALYVASAAQGILVFDLSTPGKPVQVRAVPTPRASVHTVFVHENLLFGSSSDPDGVVLVFDVKNPLAPVALSRFRPNGFDPERSYGPHDMFAFENRLYANYWGAGYVIADLTAPDRPSELGRYRYAHSTSHANAVGRYGDRLIAFEGGEDWGAHLRVLDVTHPNDVRLLTEWRLHEHISIHNLVLVGTRLYIAHYQDGVRVLDVSVPEMPRPVAHYHTFRSSDPNRGDSFYDGAIGIRVPGDGFIYAVDTSRGLLILKEG